MSFNFSASMYFMDDDALSGSRGDHDSFTGDIFRIDPNNVKDR